MARKVYEAKVTGNCDGYQSRQEEVLLIVAPTYKSALKLLPKAAKSMRNVHLEQLTEIGTVDAEARR